MRIACRAGPGLRGLYRWNQLRCIRSRAPDKFRRADRLQPTLPWFREGWKTQIVLWSYRLRFCAVKRRQKSPEHRQERAGRIERCDIRPAWGTAGAAEFSPRPDSLHNFENLLHLSQLRFRQVCDRSLDTLSGLKGAVTR